MLCLPLIIPICSQTLEFLVRNLILCFLITSFGYASSDGCAKYSNLSRVDFASCMINKMAKNYTEITAKAVYRMEGDVKEELIPYVGEDQKGVYLIEDRVNRLNTNAKLATKDYTKRVSNQITTLAGFSAKLQELDILIIEQLLMRNLILEKRDIANRLKGFEYKEVR